MNLILFDVCWTLTNVNSTNDYIKFLISKWVKPYYKLFFYNRFIKLIFDTFYEIFGINIKRILSFRFFKWLSIYNLNKFNTEYFTKYKLSLKNGKLIKKYLNNKKKYTVILISASINPPVHLLAQSYWIKNWSTVLNHKNWYYNWQYKHDLLWNKHKIFINNDINLNHYSSISLYTDNLSDIMLINYINNKCHNSKFFLILNNNKHKWLKILKKNNIIKYEFI